MSPVGPGVLRPDSQGASQPVFLIVEWRDLAMLNDAIDPAVVVPRVPRGTELDLWDGQTLVSLVGFRFGRARVRGWAIPFHEDFEAVNLRFYVRRRGPESWRRGMAFVKEIMPLNALPSRAGSPGFSG
jgi:uncharacterized protein